MNNYIVFGILLTLIKHKKCSCNFLAEKFEVSKKTIYRYANQLCASGVPIYCSQGRNGGIQILPDFDLESNFFTTDEIARISSLLSSCEIKNIDKTTKSVIEKINYTLNHKMLKSGNTSDQIIIDNLPWGVEQLYNDKILSLLDGCNRNLVIKINYTSRTNEQSTRTIHPYSLILKDGVWYLYAFCTTKQDFRLFKCSRITSINLCDVEFNRIPIKIEDKPWLTNQPLGNKITLELKVNSLALPEIYDWAKDVKICKQTANYAIVKSSALLNDGLISRLINYGNSIKVISPSSVISKIVELCKRITNEYLLN